MNPRHSLLIAALIFAMPAAVHRCAAAPSSREEDDPSAADLSALEQSLVSNPKDPSAALNLARLYRKLGYIDKAEKLYLQVIAPDSAAGNALRAEACNGLGFLHERQKDYARAIEQYRKALELRPGWVRPLLHVGSCQMDQGQCAAAEETLKLAARTDPADASPRNNLGILYGKMNRPEAAEREYRAALALRPAWTAPAWNLALLYDAQGRYRDSDDYVGRVLKADPKNFEARYLRVQHLVGSLDYAAAEREARRLMAMYPNRGEAHEALGMVLWSREDMDGAEACFRKAMELDPKSAGPYLGLGHVRMQQKRYEEAENLYQQAMGMDPTVGDSRRGYELAGRQREREKLGGGCSAAPNFADASPAGLLQYFAVIVPVLLLRRRL